MRVTSSEILAKKIRYQCITMSYKAKTAHLASSLSCIDLISVLFYSIMNFSKRNYKSISRDRFILSKGHAASALYAALNFKKILSDNDLNNYCKKNSKLEEHPSTLIPGVETSTGSLGHGLSVACGIALGLKIKKIDSKIYIIMSDGECNEGSVWEASLFASANKLDNIYCFVDYNQWQATGRTREILNLNSLCNKFNSFGWDAIEINGHNHREIKSQIKKAQIKNGKPKMFIANTIKGKGISFMEDDNNWHYRSPSKEELILSKRELKIK